jgi:hypothetical protein
MDPQVTIKRHTHPDGSPVFTVTTSTGRVIRVIGVTAWKHRESVEELREQALQRLKDWVTWERGDRWQCGPGKRRGK